MFDTDSIQHFCICIRNHDSNWRRWRTLGETRCCLGNPEEQSKLKANKPIQSIQTTTAFHTFIPQAARAGARIRLTLSPTPPVLCLSTTRLRHSAGQVSTSPDCIMAFVRVMVSWVLKPFRNAAISHAPVQKRCKRVCLHGHVHTSGVVFSVEQWT